MAGYKATVINDEAVSFWTFDGDAFDPTSRKLMVPEGSPRMIMDEIENQNPATLISDHEVYLGYRMGMPSLVVHEQEDQHSITFGYYGNQPLHPNGYARSYLEIAHTNAFSFPNFGSFSVELVMSFVNTDIGSFPIFTKSGVLNVGFAYSYSSTHLSITHPGGSVNVGTFPGGPNWVGAGNFFNRVIHFVFVWDLVESTSNSFRGTASVYLNSILASRQVYDYNDTFPNTNQATPINIAGSPTGYWKTPFALDQVAVYDKALSAGQVSDHTAKIFPYDQLLKSQYATSIWPFSDVDSLVNFNIAPYHGSVVGQYVGGRERCLRATSGPNNIFGATSCTFINGGQATWYNQNVNYAHQPRSALEYTYEWWFNTSDNQRGVMFAFQSIVYPFRGPLVQLNTRDHQQSFGSIQFTDSDDGVVLNSRYLNDFGDRFEFNDSKWHHIAITRDNTTGVLCLYLDGVLHDSKVSDPKTVTTPGQMCMMNYMPGRLAVHGALSYLAYFTHPLQQHVITQRVTYSIKYKIRGVVTLLGVPYRAKLRFYSSYDGAFIQEVQSDSDTGEYSAEFYTNSNVDILVFSPYDLSVRYRAYGPVKPSEFDDLPINI